MIISRKRSYVFVHIPKTGGTSLAQALESRAAADDLLIGDTPKARRRRARLEGLTPHGRLWKHSNLADIDGILTPSEIEQMFTFTLVRNPWDRIVSYYHWLRDQTFDHPAVSLARRLDFADFLSHPQSQASLRAGAYGSYMKTADGPERCSLYIRLEHFEEDAQLLWAHLGFEVPVPHLNRSNRPTDYRTQYSDTTRAIVADLCGEDIRRFGYCFE
jgi:hypothetical protein